MKSTTFHFLLLSWRTTLREAALRLMRTWRFIKNDFHNTDKLTVVWEEKTQLPEIQSPKFTINQTSEFR